MKRMICFVICLLMIASLAGGASADYRYSAQNGWLSFAYGGYVYIPESFSGSMDGTWTGNGYDYGFWNAVQRMSITVSEEDVSGQRSSDVIDSEYSYYSRSLPKATYDVKGRDAFVLSGYQGNSIYYIQGWLAHGTLYEISFDYPTRNRRLCDPVVEEVCGSFSAYGAQYPVTPASGIKPSSADLDMIRADIKYPNYQFMYLDYYEYAMVTHKEVYVFKDPDTDVWRRGNYFTVKYGTQVTILAKSEGYACVIFNDTNRAGWINLDYLGPITWRK